MATIRLGGSMGLRGGTGLAVGVSEDSSVSIESNDSNLFLSGMGPSAPFCDPGSSDPFCDPGSSDPFLGGFVGILSMAVGLPLSGSGEADLSSGPCRDRRGDTAVICFKVFLARPLGLLEGVTFEVLPSEEGFDVEAFGLRPRGDCVDELDVEGL